MIIELKHKAISPTIFVVANSIIIETITKQILYINKMKLINSDFFFIFINSNIEYAHVTMAINNLNKYLKNPKKTLSYIVQSSENNNLPSITIKTKDTIKITKEKKTIKIFFILFILYSSYI